VEISARGAPEEKIRGLAKAPESRKYPGMSGLRRSYFLPFFPFLVDFFAAFFFAMVLCHLLLADSIDRAERRVLAWPSLAGRGLAPEGSVDCHQTSIDFKESEVPVKRRSES
jgi:hypothetical protein